MVGKHTLPHLLFKEQRAGLLLMTVASYDSPVNSLEQLPTHASCPMGHQTLKALRGLLRTAHHFVPERLSLKYLHL